MTGQASCGSDRKHPLKKVYVAFVEMLQVDPVNHT